MDGYTVEEAASVLGVPRERVWELLARGIITGVTDLGGAIRVRLKAEPAAVPTAAPVERLADPGSGAASELTPFRELLTEFRSLTERYGQALLALGEARGEVAGLRSRVEMLEARVDLRLPTSAAPISSSWSSTPWPTPTERVAQPPPATVAAVEAAPAREDAAAADPHDADAPGHDDEAATHRRRGGTARRATERFADALARAEDPSLPELPGAAETAAALAALRQEHPPEAVRAPESDGPDREADAMLPRELPSADHVPVDYEGEVEPLPEAAAAAPLEAAGSVEDAALGAAADVEPVEPEQEPQAEPQPLPEAEAPPVAAPVEEGGEGAGDLRSEIAWDPERYTATIEEPGWISSDEPNASGGSPPEEPGEPAVLVPPRRPVAPPDAAQGQPVGGPSDERETDEPPETASPWSGSPAEATRDTSTAIPIESSSGSRRLDEGLAALDALANPRPAADVADEWAPGMEREAQPIGAPRPQAWVRPSPPPQLVTRSSASRAYRRLRRIFPT